MYGILMHRECPEIRIITIPNKFSFSVDKDNTFAGRAYTYTHGSCTLESYAYDSGYLLVQQGSVLELLEWLKTQQDPSIAQLQRDLSLLV
jgi:hypothetical protein